MERQFLSTFLRLRRLAVDKDPKIAFLIFYEEIDRLGKLSSELFHRLLQRGRIIEQDPFDHRDWQTAVLDQVVVKLIKAKILTLSIFVTAEQIHDLPFADDVADLLMWT